MGCTPGNGGTISSVDAAGSLTTAIARESFGILRNSRFLSLRRSENCDPLRFASDHVGEEEREGEAMTLKDTVEALLRDSERLSRESAKLRQMAGEFMQRADALQRHSDALRKSAWARKRKPQGRRR
jgi:hypothetical protein